MVLTHWWQWGN